MIYEKSYVQMVFIFIQMHCTIYSWLLVFVLIDYLVTLSITPDTFVYHVHILRKLTIKIQLKLN